MSSGEGKGPEAGRAGEQEHYMDEKMKPELTPWFQVLAQSGTWTKHPVCSKHSTLFPHLLLVP